MQSVNPVDRHGCSCADPHASLPIRRAARVVVLDPDDRVLLMRYDDAPPNGRHWSTPGGGLESGEDHPTAALRELIEETGWVDVRLLGEIGSGDVTMEYDGQLVQQRERLYLARTDVARRPVVDVAAMHIIDRIAAWRWWTLGELRTTTEVVWPTGLAELISRAGA
jgi:8-oxo-dGTP pyrophosphatase MutT (NUDIX family)